jgi:hypothetical protein
VTGDGWTTFTATIRRTGRWTWRVVVAGHGPGTWDAWEHDRALCRTRRGARRKARRMLARARRQEKYRALAAETVDL